MAISSGYDYFSMHELVCHGTDCGCDHGMHMNDDFMKKIVVIRGMCGFPFIVPSAFRCPVHNDRVSNTGLIGPHTTGHAIDVACYGHRAATLLEIALQQGITGIGVHQKGPREKRYIHLDDLGGSLRPWVWSY